MSHKTGTNIFKNVRCPQHGCCHLSSQIIFIVKRNAFWENKILENNSEPTILERTITVKLKE